MRAIKSGDIVFLKSFSPGSGLRIKGVGVVTDSRPHMVDLDNGYPLDRLRPGAEGLGTGVKVRGTWPGVLDGSVFWKMGAPEDRGTNLRTGTIYEESGPEVFAQVIELLPDPKLRQGR